MEWYTHPDDRATRDVTDFLRRAVAAQPAPHIGHQNHLCVMCGSGGCSLEQVKALVKDPKFLCRKCGRAAVNEDNLCEPVPL